MEMILLVGLNLVWFFVLLVWILVKLNYVIWFVETNTMEKLTQLKVNDLDKDGNGMIDFEEFLELVKNLGSDQDDLLEAFK